MATATTTKNLSIPLPGWVYGGMNYVSNKFTSQKFLKVLSLLDEGMKIGQVKHLARFIITATSVYKHYEVPVPQLLHRVAVKAICARSFFALPELWGKARSLLDFRLRDNCLVMKVVKKRTYKVEVAKGEYKNEEYPFSRWNIYSSKVANLADLIFVGGEVISVFQDYDPPRWMTWCNRFSSWQGLLSEASFLKNTWSKEKNTTGPKIAWQEVASSGLKMAMYATFIALDLLKDRTKDRPKLDSSAFWISTLPAVLIPLATQYWPKVMVEMLPVTSSKAKLEEKTS